MAIPRVFISSTCYDLKYIRGNLLYLVRSLGYEPVLSEEGDVFYDPGKHTHDIDQPDYRRIGFAAVSEIQTREILRKWLAVKRMAKIVEIDCLLEPAVIN